MAKVNGHPIYDALLSVMNEDEQIKALFLTIGTSHQSMSPVLKNIMYWLEKFNLALPELSFVDKCCTDKDFLHEQLKLKLQGIQPVEISLAGVARQSNLR